MTSKLNIKEILPLPEQASMIAYPWSFFGFEQGGDC